jgi:hydrogenase expression/formation protein HypD
MNTAERQLLDEVTRLADEAALKLGRTLRLMEVCGTHTTAISRNGLRSLMADRVEFRSGPGCPVCVTDQYDIDRIVALARVPGVVVATFGDMVRVPGTLSSLEKERARGATVEVFYSPHDAVTYAAGHPGEEVVFLGVGFETTAPVVGLSIEETDRQGLNNYSVFSVHKRVPPAIDALLGQGGTGVDGFILPGHVCAITGRTVFDFISSRYGLPAVVTGFEDSDILKGLSLLLSRIISGKAETMNGYGRLVRDEGNRKAQEALSRYFEPVSAPWRGLGLIPESGLAIRPGYARFDASLRFPLTVPYASPPEGCSCGAILKGTMEPADCPLFAHSCTPACPVGPCMVSSEGACAAHYRYGDVQNNPFPRRGKVTERSRESFVQGIERWPEMKTE